jgi:uncharacterized membrane protein
MVLHQVSAVSYDAVQLSLFPVIFGFITKFAVDDRQMTRRELAIFFFVLLWSINVRLLSYSPLLLLLFALRPLSVPGGRKLYWRTLLPLGVGAAAITAAVNLVYLPSVQADGFTPGSVNARKQIVHILSEPWDFLAACYRTLDRDGEWIFTQIIGVFGWTQTQVAWFVIFGVVLVAGMIIYRTVEADKPRLPPLQVAAIVTAVMLSLISLFVSLYAVWSPVKADIVMGLQGRYFLGLILLGVFGFSQLAARVGRRRFLHAGLLLAAIAVFANIVRTIDIRYYD